MPFYEEIARTPFFVWDPRHQVQGERRTSLVQPAIDLPPTLLDWFGAEPLEFATGKNLSPVVADDTPVRETAVFGIFGGQVNITDGKHVYMRGYDAVNGEPALEYTLMPAHMRGSFSVDELQNLSLAEPFAFTRGVRPLCCGYMNVWGENKAPPDRCKTLLWDVETDPAQQHPLQDAQVERRLVEALHRHLLELDAPAEQWLRLGLAPEWTKGE